MPTRKGSIFLFRLFGVSVYLHYSWFLIALLQIYLVRGSGATFSGHAQPIPYHILLYLCLFLIVLIHEFGHSLACKSVGGKSDTIVLFPFGGVSYVQPPQRAGAMLWSIAAGPLVNVVLLPVTIVPLVLLHAYPLFGSLSTVGTDLLTDIAGINAMLLFFNILPVYPLDGGQILRSLLWFISGRAISLLIAASIGLACTILGVITALVFGDWWLAAVAGFLAMQAWVGLKYGQMYLRLERAPRHADAQCPHCHEHPPAVPMWQCKCGNSFDLFAHQGHCPACAATIRVAPCPYCEERAALEKWYEPAVPPIVLPPSWAEGQPRVRPT
ncbi:MAG TPA: M50 family metallopeptidase [Phycisphaerae bacterium]|jgi:Zn-dependent protease|nr:M50 family metallopeptidase [Phycisphaerae bacterium]